ncbi:thymidylate synthase [Oxalobacter sp. OttesenSCG-928-P03]|nr:thymidylate synthase [Oxalobacter sp. OttesenSCG-928-P03]
MEQQYLALLEDILDNGVRKNDRTGTGTLSVFGRMYRHDLSKGFPLLTTKRLHIRSIIHELLWFLRGGTSIQYLNENGVTIWDEWATPEGELGPIYGAQWRFWEGANGAIFDQVENVIASIKNNPDSRRHIINAWNVALLPDETKSPQQNVLDGKMALAPCHVMYQFWVAEGKLSAMMTQRSGDIFLGIPYNAASLAFLTHMVAQQTGLEPGEIVHSIGDLHIYSNHMEQVHTQLSREPRLLPQLEFARKPASILDYTYDDFIINGYDPHPAILAPIAV